MKKFLKVRNIIIILMIIIVIAIFAYMRQGDITTSKTHSYLGTLETSVNYVINLEDKKEGTVKETLAVGNYEMENDKYNDIAYLERHYSKDTVEKLLKKFDEKLEQGQEKISQYAKDISQTCVDISEWKENANKSSNKSFVLANDKKVVLMNEENNEGEGFTKIALFNTLREIVYSSKYYIRGFEFAEGKLLYCESFKNDNIGQVKIFFEDDMIKYIKFENLNLLEVSLEKKEISKSLLKIPANYKDLNKEENVTEKDLQNELIDNWTLNSTFVYSKI